MHYFVLLHHLIKLLSNYTRYENVFKPHVKIAAESEKNPLLATHVLPFVPCYYQTSLLADDCIMIQIIN